MLGLCRNVLQELDRRHISKDTCRFLLPTIISSHPQLSVGIPNIATTFYSSDQVEILDDCVASEFARLSIVRQTLPSLTIIMY